MAAAALILQISLTKNVNNMSQRIYYTLVPVNGAPVQKHFDYPGSYDKGCDFIKKNIDYSEILEIIFHEPDYRKDFAEEADTSANN